MRRSLFSLSFALSLAVSAAICLPALGAEPGALDASFGTRGIATIGNVLGSPKIAAFSDGRMVVTDGDRVQWLTSSGESDSSRPVQVMIPTGPMNGSAQVCIDLYTECGPDIATRADGSSLVLRDPGSGREIRAFANDGGPETSFGVNGVATLPFSAGPIVVRSDGSIVVAGWRYDASTLFGDAILLAVLTPDGQLDPGFGGDGVIETGLTGAPRAMTETAAGNLLVAGSDRGQAVAWRFLPSGVPDASFGNAGRTNLSSKPVDFNSSGDHTAARSLVTRPDGSALFAGSKEFIGCTIRGPWDCTSGYVGRIAATPPQGSVLSTTTMFDSSAIAFGAGGDEFLTGVERDFSGQISVVRLAGGPEILRDNRYGRGGYTLPIDAGGGAPTDALALLDGRQVVATGSRQGAKLVRLLGDEPGIAAPNAHIFRLDRSRLKKRRKLSVVGFASPSDARIEIALLKVRSVRTAKRHGCRWYDVRKRTFRARRSAGGVCRPQRFQQIDRGAEWEFAPSPRLSPGTYSLWMRARSANGKLVMPVSNRSERHLRFYVHKN